MNAQEIFDTACAGVIAQGMQSVDGCICMYRTEREGEALKCAAGHLIPDEMYSPGMERATWDRLIKLYNLKHFDEHKDLISDLQLAHDICTNSKGKKFTKEFIVNVKYVAQKHELNINVLENHDVKS